MPDSHTLRADAELNRARVLDAAREVFAEFGLDVPLAEVARRAGVGIATLYRRFPTADDLVDAVFASKMDEYANAAEEALDADDPWKGFAGYVRHVCAMQAADAGFADVLALSPRPAFAEQRSRAFRAFAKLVQRAKRDGTLRRDFVHQDLVILLMANAGVARASLSNDAALERFAEYMLQAFRAPASAPLPQAPTPLETYRALEERSKVT